MNTITFDMVGTMPLMLNGPTGIDPRNEIVKQLKLITDKRKLTEDDQNTVLRLKFDLSLYHDPVLGPYLPAFNVVTAVTKTAALSRAGKKIERGVYLIGDERLPIKYEGPRDRQGLWDAGFVDIRAVKLKGGGGTVLASRAMFREWQITMSALLDPTQINERDFLGYLALTGQIMGVGTYRRRFGRFKALFKGKEVGIDGKLHQAEKEAA